MQLQMYIMADVAARIPPWTPPEGYSARTYRPGDEPRWAKVMQLAGFEEWNEEKLAEAIQEPERLEGTRFIVQDSSDLIVAATMASERTADPWVGGIDWVSGDPDHKGKGLGYGVCARVVKYLVERGYPKIHLSTDDWRLPAVKGYLKLGFVPDMCREDMPERWRKVCEQLNWPYTFEDGA